jgi:hypothetical protein
MFETDAEIDELDALLARTYARANTHLTGIVKPERRLNSEPTSMWAYAFHPENFSE